MASSDAGAHGAEKNAAASSEAGRGSASFTLRQGLLGLLLAAFLPAGGLTLGQAYGAYSEMRGLREAQLMQDAELAARAPEDLILAARSALRVAREQRIGGTGPSAACDAALRRVVASNENFYAAHFTSAGGMIECGSLPDFKPMETSSRPSFQKIIRAGRPITLVAYGRSSQREVVIVAEPVAAAGATIGYLSISILTERFDALAKLRDKALTERFALFAPGSPFAFDLGETWGWLPDESLIDALSSGAPQLVYATSRDKRPFVYAVTDVADGEVFSLSAWPEEEATEALTWRTLAAIAPPLLAWGAAILVVYLAANRLVLRHTARLARLTDRLRLGDLSARSEIPPHAPQEFVDLGAQFDAMASGIEERESRLRQAVREERLLLREVYHRVKNNLQLIVSLINLQGRDLESEAERAVLQRTQDRVQSLATVHQHIYQVGRLDEARLDLILEQLVASIKTMRQADRPEIALTLELEPIRIEADRAVPAAMLTTEAVINAYKHAWAPGESGWLTVTLKADGATGFHLRIVNSLGEAAKAAQGERTGLGRRLMAGFARQLRSVLTAGARGDVFEVSVWAPPSVADGPAGDHDERKTAPD